MKRITVAMLERLRACDDQVALFRETFGAWAALTDENADKAAEAGLDVNWLARVVLTDERRAEYERATATAWAKYHRATAPAWAKYDRAWAECQRACACAFVRLAREGVE